MLDAIIISDIHLGSDNCQARHLTHFLERIDTGELRSARLILNGDVFDSIDFRRLKKHHWKVLSLLRKLSDQIEIIWITGNHDGASDIVSHLLGVSVLDDYVLESGGRRVLILHGHQFDRFIDKHPILTWVGDCIYSVLQRVDRTHTIARFAKKKSKTFLRCADKIRDGALELAKKLGCHAVCCGHTHHSKADAEPGVAYFNSGCWTELPCTYLTVVDGHIRLHQYEEPAVAAEAEHVPALVGESA